VAFAPIHRSGRHNIIQARSTGGAAPLIERYNRSAIKLVFQMKKGPPAAKHILPFPDHFLPSALFLSQWPMKLTGQSAKRSEVCARSRSLSPAVALQRDYGPVHLK
jgi:hypothetical protein